MSASSGSASGSISAGSALALRFDRRGDLSAVTLGTVPGDPVEGVSLSVVGADSRALCVYGTGLAVQQSCG